MLAGLRCSTGHEYWRKWTDLIGIWEPGIPFCGHCNQPVRWFGEWQPPKAASPGTPPRRYEVLFVSYLDPNASEGDRWTEEGYLPALILCETPPESGNYVVWPRYWVKPAETIQFGQDGPQLSLDEWEYLMSKVRRFISERAGQKGEDSAG
jgi:hypothetical protein